MISLYFSFGISFFTINHDVVNRPFFVVKQSENAFQTVAVLLKYCCKQHIFIATCAKKALHISVISVIYKIHSANLFLYSTCIIMLRITSSFPCSKDISPIYILATRRMLFKPIPCSLPDLVVSGKSLSPKLS